MLKQNLDSRGIQILQHILAAQETLTAGKIAKNLNISPRMVRYNLAAIRDWLSNQQVYLSIIPHVGIRLDADDTTRQKLLKMLGDVDVLRDFSSEDRKAYLLYLLLSATKPQKQTDLTLYLSCSSSTLQRDLEEVEERLDDFQLFLKRRKLLGYQVVGDELAIRNCLVSHILSLLPEMIIIDYCIWGKANPQKLAELSQAGQIVFDDLRKWQINEVWQILKDSFSLWPGSSSDHDYLYAVIYLTISIQRSKQGLPLNGNIETPAVHNHEVRNLIKKIRKQINDRFRTLFPDNELENFFRFARYSFENDVNMPTVLKNRTSLPVIIGNFINRIGKRIKHELIKPEAAVRLEEHLRRALVKLRYGLPIYNPLADKIANTYSELFKMVKEEITSLEESLGINFPDEEIAYIVMYLGIAYDLIAKTERKTPRFVIACPTGGVTVWMLVSRLKIEMPYIEIVDTVSLQKLARLDHTAYDFIISTARFNFGNKPVLTISPLVTDVEVKKIANAINNFSNANG